MLHGKYDMVGKRFGILVVVRQSPKSRNGVYWECLCDCGGSTVAYGGHLRSGSTKSCGCILKNNREAFRATKFKHGKTGHKMFLVWSDMIRRCYSKRRNDYKNYGGRGITVCDKWRNSFVDFMSDMGECQPFHTLERIDTNGDYEPGNVKWATRAEQNRNSRNSKRWHINGIVFDSASLAAEYFGVCHVTILNWCKSKKSNCYSEALYV